MSHTQTAGNYCLASDPSSQFVQPQRHGMVRPPEDALRFPDAPVQVVQGHLGLERPALGPVNFRAASLNDAITSSVKTFLRPPVGAAGSAIKRPCEPVPVTHAPEGHRPDAKRRVHRSAARLPARPRPAPLVATNSSPGVCSVPTPPSHCISPPVCWRSITPPVAVAGSWECTLAASPGTR